MLTKQDIELELSEKQEPVARVPCDAAWDLVEYLANQRAHVQYSFEESRVIVRFLHTSLATASQLLEMWRQSGMREEARRSHSHSGAAVHS